MRPSLLAASLVCLLLVAPSVLAQDHEHEAASGPRLVVQADLPEDGRALVGHPAHFQFILLDDDDATIVHQDVGVKVTLNNVVLYQTESAHDYDGTGGLDVTFPVPGTYSVEFYVPGNDDLSATYEGYAVESTEAVVAALDLIEFPENPVNGELTRFAYANVDTDGNLLAHTDVLVEIRRVSDDFPVLQVHTHSHDDIQEFYYAFEKGGLYEVRFVGYQAFPDKASIEMVPYVATHEVEVVQQLQDGGVPDAPDVPNPLVEEAVPVPDESDSPYASTLVADPVTGTGMEVGPFSQVRNTLVTRDKATDTLVQHINYAAAVTGPDGVIFTSESLHEYDGALEIMTANQALGTYAFVAEASRGDWHTVRGHAWDVVPTVLPQGAGPQHLYAKLLDQQQTGAPRHVELFAGTGEGGAPFMHSEVALRIDDNAGLPLVMHKLHTHMSGTFGFDMAYAEAGPHTMQADLFDIHGSPTPLYFGPMPNTPTRYVYEVQEVDAFPALVVSEAADEAVVPETETVPGPAFVLAVAALGLVVVARRRLL